MAYSSIVKPGDYFNTKLYVADQQDNRTITGVGFQPDFVWLKDRDQAVSHQLYDAVRGSLKSLASNNTNSEATETDTLKAFASDGFTLGTGWGNQSTGDNYVSWNWKAGGTGSANTDGTITSTVSANQTAGFSIVSYTGTGTDPETIGHGLGVVPKMIIVKDRSTSGGWRVYNENIGNDKILALDSTITSTTSDAWNSTTPTSSLFTVGNDTITNGNGTTHIAYCFAEKKGYSKFGKYTGNGNTSGDGSFVYTGFKPAFFMVKNVSTSGHGWYMVNNKVDTDNPTNKYLVANTSAAEASFDWFDLNSNGIKIRGNSGGANANGDSYIYMAFAEEPLVANVGASIPATAR